MFRLIPYAILLFSLNLFAQNPAPLFIEVETPALAKITAHPFGKRATLVNIDWRSLAGSKTPLSQAMLSEWLNLNLPGEVNLNAKRTRIAWRGSERFTWSGESEGSTVTLSVHKGVMSGVIHTDGKVFEVEPITGETHRITELDQTLFEELERQHDDQETETTMEALPPDITAWDANETEIDVMILYEKAVENRYTNVTSFMDALIEVSNEAYVRSGIPQKIRLVHHQSITVNASGASASLRWLRENSAVASLRDKYGADLVALIIDDGSNGIGIANMNGAFSVTARSSALGNRTFTHELGHNMGAGHDRAQMTNPSGYRYGYINNAKKWRTIMSYATKCSNCPRINNFSSPLVNHNGDYTGVANSMDNARGMREKSQSVSNFRKTIVPTSSSGFKLVVTKQGRGTVTSNPASSINCGSVCSANLPSGSVTLTATPASSGWVFKRWTGACTGTNRTCTLNVNADRQTVAEFEHPNFFRISLLDVDAKKEIRVLTGKDTLNLAGLPANFTIEAIPVEAVGSIHFQKDGAQSRDHIENQEPYTLYSESADASLPWNPRPVAGQYQLTATAYTNSGAGGEILATRQISLTLISAPVALQNGFGLPATGVYALKTLPQGVAIHLSRSEVLEISLQSLDGKSTILAKRIFSPGFHQVNWSSNHSRRGLHFLHVEGESGKQMQKVFLID